jgi:serine/threonine-protein kinase HipA
MSRDRDAVVWTRLGGRPQRMGRLYLTERDCRFSYDEAYLASQLPGLGIIYAPQVFGRNTIIRPRNAAFDFLPPIQALLPPRGEHNFQRQLVLNYLASQGIQPAPGLDSDWEILKLAGHGGIGHLDVFESDDKAQNWYAAPNISRLFAIGHDAESSLKQLLNFFDDDARALLQVIGPTPSVGGAIPKLLVSIAESGWDGRIALPSRQATPGLVDVVLKFEQAQRYPGLLELEALALDIHRTAGFEVPRYWQGDINGLPVLAVERFDRDAGKYPLFVESLYSILASGDHSLVNNYSYSYDKIVNAIDRSPIEWLSDRKAGKLYLLRRLILALLTGNGDLHLENLCIVRRQNQWQFSPVYDPTPMRAYSVHNMLAVMPFGDYGELLPKHENPVGLVEALQRFAQHAGIKKQIVLQQLEELLTLTQDYAKRLEALRRLPDANKKNLIEITRKLREQFAKIK